MCCLPASSSRQNDGCFCVRLLVGHLVFNKIIEMTSDNGAKSRRYMYIYSYIYVLSGKEEKAAATIKWQHRHSAMSCEPLICPWHASRSKCSNIFLCNASPTGNICIFFTLALSRSHKLLLLYVFYSNKSFLLWPFAFGTLSSNVYLTYWLVVFAIFA